MTGTSNMMNHAPPRELGDGDDDRDDAGGDRTAPVDGQTEPPPFFLDAKVPLRHACLRQRERREDADGVERDQVRDVRLEHDRRGLRRAGQRR